MKKDTDDHAMPTDETNPAEPSVQNDPLPGWSSEDRARGYQRPKVKEETAPAMPGR